MSYLDSIKFIQILSLFEILIEIKNKDIDFIETIYNKRAGNFLETIRFFKKLGIINISDKKIQTTEKFIKLEKCINNTVEYRSIIKEFLINHIFEDSNSISNEVKKYISNYKEVECEFIYIPRIKENISFSGIRNLLMELDVLFLDNDKRTYKLKTNFLFHVQKPIIPISVSLFNKIQQGKKELGDSAELLVFENEKKRFEQFPDLYTKIRHISKEIVNAGYDIESFTDSNLEKKFIEVKAISIYNSRFFWSRNEINSAKELRNNYWLFLVPYNHKNIFLTAQIEMFSDPYKKFILNKENWKTQVELYSFSRDSTIGEH